MNKLMAGMRVSNDPRMAEIDKEVRDAFAEVGVASPARIPWPENDW